MPNDPYYRSREWQSLRAKVCIRALGWCETPGCRNKGTICDHIVSRANGGANEIANLRWLCADCDNQVKEDANGVRRSRGQASVRGCDANGRPLDPNHPWNRGRGG